MNVYMIREFFLVYLITIKVYPFNHSLRQHLRFISLPFNMAAAAPRKNRGWHRLYVLCISYILISGLSPQIASNDLNNISSSFYAGKATSTPQLSSTLLKAKNKATEIPASMKLAKLSRLVQYWSLASLLLLSGDICPNPGWAYPELSRPQNCSSKHPKFAQTSR